MTGAMFSMVWLQCVRLTGMETIVASNVADVQCLPPTVFTVYWMDHVLEVVNQGSTSLILRAKDWVFIATELHYQFIPLTSLCDFC
jgi:hypothetical protein